MAHSLPSELIRAVNKLWKGFRLERLLFTIKEASQAFGVCERTVYRLMDNDKLVFVRLGNRRMIPRHALLNAGGLLPE